ncbi:GAF domain-containing protein [Desulfobotulus pelophilus]|uniref:GAF domain-containing protein n=1 Tax=Desulfobotulus pelophilus TaxID=2823377 RepID=UPI0026E54FA9|nr:GAF domain-containing protein [Desulfobotulus pelophilus]
MIVAPFPENETERLRMLGLYRVLDTASDKTLDELTGLAAVICGTPISLISLVDKERQWFKARVGLDVIEWARHLAFCSHAILKDEVLIVEDASQDPRFCGNPLVTGDPLIRFYAGAPLCVPGGFALGTLCVIDRRPRRLSSHQLEALQVLGQAVVSQLELRRLQQDLHSLEKFLPMCAWCRSVRTDDGKWQSLQSYVADMVPVTHGICPVCSGEAEWGEEDKDDSE